MGRRFWRMFGLTIVLTAAMGLIVAIGFGLMALFAAGSLVHG